jgi:Ni,Fe-hydrogenase III large subunit
LRYYKFGKPGGRLIGNTEKYTVYENTVSERRDKFQKLFYQNLPGEFTFSYGPATGGLLESVAFQIKTPGELIKQVVVDPYFKTRTINLTGLAPQDALLKIERINGFHAAANAISFEMAVEDALGIEVTDEINYSRIVMLELERIRSNLEVVKRLCEPAGFGVPENQVAHLREEVTRLISMVTGHRYFFSASSIGGCLIRTSGLEENIIKIKDQFETLFNNLLQSKIFLNRLQNNGVIKNGPLLGPAARAAGMIVDARISHPVLPYGKLGFKIAVFDEPDAFGRFYVRSQEILNSAELILEALNNCGNRDTVNSSAVNGEGAARLESPQGDLFYYVKIDHGVIQDVQISSPSLLNIDAFRRSMAGNIFTDFHFNWESFGIWISELAVVIK